MWGNILTEVSYMQNFNMGFSNNKADVLIHLTQWQYWWWFWFSFLWVLYYLIVARVFRYRTLKFNPRIASTLRPHGKWGDLLTCIIPVTWCLNILINSNFILKLIEWQSESSLFTLRVRAKQWYWIYKLDLRNISDIFSAPRNIGRNKWQFSTFGDLQTADDYLHIMQMRAYSSWSKDFWSELGKKSTKKNKYSVNTNIDFYREEFLNNLKITKTDNILKKKLMLVNGGNFNIYTQNKKINNVGVFDGTLISTTLLKTKKTTFSTENFFNLEYRYLFSNHYVEKFFKSNFLKKTQKFISNKEVTSIQSLLLKNIKSWNFTNDETYNICLKNSLLNYNTNTTVGIQHPDLDDETRIIKRNLGKNTPIRILKQPKTDFFMFDNQNNYTELLRLRFNDKVSTTANKPVKPTVYLTFKQKRYNQRNIIGKKNISFFDKNTNKQQKYSGNPFLKNNSIIEENFSNPTKQYRMVKKAKARVDNTRVANWNRLLRSRRVLVLPAHINITVITNSFDIVHSWHIPGLGLKMDCLPGRATHHTLYIDNVGLYYGQCAEICGRYHHHMPIRICALPFEHFLVWWHTFGLPKFLFPSNKETIKNNATKFFNRKFSW